MNKLTDQFLALNFPTMIGLYEGAPVFLGTLTPEQSIIRDAIIAAQDKTGADLAMLKALLTTEQQTLYIAARKISVQAERRSRYTAETDSLRAEMDYDYTVGSDEWNAALAEWKGKVEMIKAELPYPAFE